MKLAEKRPAAFVCGVFVITSFISVYFFRSAFFYICIACLVTALLLLLHGKDDDNESKKRIIISLTLAALLVPIVNICVNEFYGIPRIREFSDDDPSDIKGVVVASFSEDDHIKYVLETSEVSGKKTNFRILVEKFGNISSYNTLFLPGDTVLCKAVISPIDANNGYWYSYCADGIYISAEPESIELLKSGEGTLPRIIFDITESLKKHTDNFKNSVFIRAVLFGDKSLVSDEFKENINNAGLSHYLAVSGLHLTLIIGGIFSFLKRLGVHRRVNSVISALLCIAYMAICGFSPSVVRAGTMLIMYNVSVIVRKDSDAPTSLCVASFLMVALDPRSVYDIGFKLSFSSALGIIVGAVPYNKYIGEKKFFNSDNNVLLYLAKPLLAVSRALITTVSAIVFSFPFLLIEFRYINVLSPIYNLIAAVIFIPIMYFTLGSMALYVVSDVFVFAQGVLSSLAEITGDAVDMMSEAFEALINFFGSFSESLVYVRVSVTIVTSAVFSAFFIYFAVRKVHVKFYPVLPLAVVSAAVISSGIFYFAVSERLSVYNVSDRTDEKLIMRYKDDVIIGELTTKGYYTSKHALEELVYDKGITSADGYFVSAYSEKLPDQLQMVCKMISVEKIYIPYPSDENEKEIFLSVFELCYEKGIKLERFAYGRTTTCKSFEVTFEKLKTDRSEKLTGYEMSVTAGNKTELVYTSCRECFKDAHKSFGDVLLHLKSTPDDDMEYGKKFYGGDIVKSDVYDESLTYVTENVSYFGFHVYKKYDKDSNPRLKIVTDG